MGRKSKLTPDQWAEVERRMVEGDSIRALAGEFGVSESAIRQKLGDRAKKIREVAQDIVSAEEKLKTLPETSRITARNYAAQILQMQDDYIHTLGHAMNTARRAHAAANKGIREIKDPLDAKNLDKMRAIAGLADLGNRNLAAATGKEVVARIALPAPEGDGGGGDDGAPVIYLPSNGR